MEVLSYNKVGVQCRIESEPTRRTGMPLNGDRVRSLREKRNLSQAALGESLGIALIELTQKLRPSDPLTEEEKDLLYEEGKVSQQQIDRWEKEKSDPKGEAIALLATALGCTADYLLNLVSEPYQRIEEHTLRPDQRKLLDLYETGKLSKRLRRILGLGDPTLLLPTTTETSSQPGVDESLTSGDEEETDRKVS